MDTIFVKIWSENVPAFYARKTLDELNALTRRGFDWRRIW